MTSSKLSSRRFNAGTPRVTRASRTHKCKPTGHSLSCYITVPVSPVAPSSTHWVDFFAEDTGLPVGDPMDHVAIQATGGTWSPVPPIPMFNAQIQQVQWTAPAQQGIYTLGADYWWSDLHSCHAEDTVAVVAP